MLCLSILCLLRNKKRRENQLLFARKSQAKKKRERNENEKKMKIKIKIKMRRIHFSCLANSSLIIFLLFFECLNLTFNFAFLPAHTNRAKREFC